MQQSTQNKASYRPQLSGDQKTRVEQKATTLLKGAGIFDKVVSDAQFQLRVPNGQQHPLTIRRKGTDVEFSQSGFNNDGSSIGTKTTFAINNGGLAYKDSVRFISHPDLAPKFLDGLVKNGFGQAAKTALTKSQQSQLKP